MKTKEHFKEYHSPVVLVNDIDPKFDQYVNSFLKEAKARGIKLNPQHIHVKQNDLLYVRCKCDGLTLDMDSLIFIDTRSLNWILDPEFLVYHELGHLLLQRNHKDMEINGYALSLMHTSAIIAQTENTKLRNLYVNELFDSTNVKDLISELHKVPHNPKNEAVE